MGEGPVWNVTCYQQKDREKIDLHVKTVVIFNGINENTRS